MIPAAFEYLCPATVDEAVALLSQFGEEAKLLAGGHSLLPAMKLRLAQPRTVIDVGRIPELSGIREEGGKLVVGARTTHHALENSPLVRAQCPLLTEVALEVGDVQVRNRGTLGGSLVHADPAADWPAALLALEGELEIAGPGGRRVVSASDFFVDMMQTAVGESDLLCEIRLPITGPGVSYVKSRQKASGFAIAGVAVVLDPDEKRVRVGVTGVAAVAYRAREVEAALEGRDWDGAALGQAAAAAAAGVEPLGDIHASSEYRAHLAVVNTRRALEQAISRLGAEL